MNNDESTEENLTCCNGLGWTGDPSERCADHYEPLDAIWFS